MFRPIWKNLLEVPVLLGVITPMILIGIYATDLFFANFERGISSPCRIRLEISCELIPSIWFESTSNRLRAFKSVNLCISIDCESITIEALASLVSKLYGGVPLVFENPNQEMSHYVPSTGIIEKKFGVSQKVSLEDGLVRWKSWLESNWI